MYRFLILIAVTFVVGLNAVKPADAQSPTRPYIQQTYHGGQSFGDALPWGQHFGYGISNIQRPRDNAYHVTVVYSSKGVRTEQDKYLHAWFRKHPALASLRSQTNFCETYISDPTYQSYLRSSLPVVPAIMITKPPAPGGGYWGEVVYCAYGQYLSSDPNIIALEIQTALRTIQPHYTQAAWLPVQPVQYQQYQPYQPYRPYQPYQPYQPQQYPQAIPPVIPNINATTRRTQSMLEDPVFLLLAIGGVIAVYFVLSGRNSRRRR